jgi:hypothetical protein
MIKLVLRSVANVIFPGIAGYVVTLHLLLPLAMVWLPGFRPEAATLVVLTGVVTTLLCLVPQRARVLLRQRVE